MGTFRPSRSTMHALLSSAGLWCLWGHALGDGLSPVANQHILLIKEASLLATHSSPLFIVLILLADCLPSGMFWPQGKALIM